MGKTTDDHILISQILARDRHALSLFYRRYTPRLSSFISHKINNPADAEEVLQDTLFAFLESARDFQGASSVKTFLFSICRNKIVDFYRRKKIKQVVFSRTPNLEALVSPILNPEEELDTKMLKEKIHIVLGRLLPQYRKLLVLKYMDNLTAAEIAQRFAVTLKSVESQLFRARKAFVESFLSI
jgi:RNA polymerase sigma-70 factor (ECF subfamily)